MLVTRFAPSPSGYLHLGHAYSAILAYEIAKKNNGKFVLRMEDIDTSRCKRKFEEAILEDLEWLGLAWSNPVRRQSEHLTYYQEALHKLQNMGLIYPCFCTRKDILAEITLATEAPHNRASFIYPGTCRHLSNNIRKTRIVNNVSHSFRLDIQKALELSKPIYWEEFPQERIRVQANYFGDIIIARKDIPTSYHLAVTLDDHVEGVTLVTRGEDLFESTHIQRLIQFLLGLRVPTYRHHRLLKTSKGERFAKRDRSLTLRNLRESGCSPDSIWKAMLNENGISQFIYSIEQQFRLI